MIAPNEVRGTISASLKRSCRRACSASSTECGSSTSRRPKSAISSSNSLSRNAAGSSPASISSRRKNVEQIRQSLRVEIACERIHIRRSPTTGTSASNSGYHESSASNATGECARVHFMLVMRPPEAACAAAIARESEGAERSESGGMRAIAEAYENGDPDLANALPSALMGAGRKRGESRVQDLRPGARLAGYRIEAIERDDGGAAVLRAQDPVEGREVALHVAAEPPGSVATVRFLERANRLQGVVHPHLLPVYDVRTIDDRALVIAEAPPGRRLDAVLGDGPLGPEQATRIAPQVASAVEALEGAGAELPPITPERVWVSAGNAYLDPLDGRSLLNRTDRPPSSARTLPTRTARPPPSPAAVAYLLDTMVKRDNAPAPLCEVLSRALDGAYFSVAQITDALRRLEAGSADRARRRRRAAIALAVAATVVLLVILAITLA